MSLASDPSAVASTRWAEFCLESPPSEPFLTPPANDHHVCGRYRRTARVSGCGTCASRGAAAAAPDANAPREEHHLWPGAMQSRAPPRLCGSPFPRTSVCARLARRWRTARRTSRALEGAENKARRRRRAPACTSADGGCRALDLLPPGRCFRPANEDGVCWTSSSCRVRGGVMSG